MMKRIIWALLVSTVLFMAGCKSVNPAPTTPATKPPEKEPARLIMIKTSMGNIKAELFARESPETARNFCQYIDSGFFKDTIFHRIKPGFVIQGGGFSTAFIEKPTMAPVVNEATNSLKNNRGTLAMARTPDINSATSQFFINLVDNDRLNHTDKNTSQGFGYCVFGRVTEGMDVVDRISAVKTGSRGEHEDVPKENVVILSIERAD